jgi:hypothetical protein
MERNSGDKKRVGHFEREAKLNLVVWILVVLLGFLAVYFYRYTIELFRK